MLRIQKVYQDSRPFFGGISGAERRFINSFSDELPRSRAARYQKEFLLTPMQSIKEFF